MTRIESDNLRRSDISLSLLNKSSFVVNHFQSEMVKQMRVIWRQTLCQVSTGALRHMNKYQTPLFGESLEDKRDNPGLKLL